MINTCQLDVNTTLPLVCIGSLFSFLCGVGIGANDLSANFAMVVGSGSLKMKSAIIYCAVFELLGAAFMGGKVSNTIRNGIVQPILFTQNRDAVVLGMTCASFAAALWLYLSTVFGLPVSITHTVIGSIIGFAVFMTWSFDQIEARGLTVIVASWVIAPIAACMVTACIFYYMRRFIFHVRGHSFERALHALPYCLLASLLVDLMFIVIERPPIMTQRFVHWLPVWVQFVLLFIAILAFCQISAHYVFPRVAIDALEAREFVWESSAIRTELIRRPSADVLADEARVLENSSFFRRHNTSQRVAPQSHMLHTYHNNPIQFNSHNNDSNKNNNNSNNDDESEQINRNGPHRLPYTDEHGNIIHDHEVVLTQKTESFPYTLHDFHETSRGATHMREKSMAPNMEASSEIRTRSPALLSTPMSSGVQTPSLSMHGRSEPAIRLTSLTTSDNRIVPQGSVHLAPVTTSASSSFTASTGAVAMALGSGIHYCELPYQQQQQQQQQPPLLLPRHVEQEQEQQRELFYSKQAETQKQQRQGRRLEHYRDMDYNAATEDAPLLGHATSSMKTSSSQSSIGSATAAAAAAIMPTNCPSFLLSGPHHSENIVKTTHTAMTNNNSNVNDASLSHKENENYNDTHRPMSDITLETHLKASSNDRVSTSVNINNNNNNVNNNISKQYDSVKGSTPIHTFEQDEDANQELRKGSPIANSTLRKPVLLPRVNVSAGPESESTGHFDVMTELILPNSHTQTRDNSNGNKNMFDNAAHSSAEVKMGDVFGDDDWAMDHPMQPINFGGLLIKPFNPRAEYLFTGLQVVAGSMSSFVHGAVAGANATAAFVILYDAFSNHELNESDLSTTWSVLPAMLGIAIGMFALGASLMKTVGVELVTVTPARGWCIQVGGTLVTMILTGIGIPVSLSQSQVGAAIGCGVLDAQLRGVSWKLVGKIVIGWVITLVISAVTTGMAMWLLGTILC